jgi:DNA-binding transcriptional regulator YiaG
MPNFIGILKEEIIRLARKEVRREIDQLKKASAKYRSEIAELKRRIGEIEKLQARSDRRSKAKVDSTESSEGAGKFRFRAQGFANLRKRLGLSANEVGTLLGISAQTIYNWETGKTRPRASQLPVIASLRTMGKREIKAALAAGSAESPVED